MSNGDTKMINMGGSGPMPSETPQQNNQYSQGGHGGGLSDSIQSTMVASAVDQAKQTALRGVAEIRNFVEQNPSQVRATVFMMGACQLVYCGLGIINIFALTFTPVEFLVNLYLCLFAVVTLVLEGKAEWPGVQRVQEKLFYEVHMLSTVAGRAMFYVFQGTLGMARYHDDLLMGGFGFGFFTIGVLIMIQQYRLGRGAGGQSLLENQQTPYQQGP